MTREDYTYGGDDHAESLLCLERDNAREFPAMPDVRLPYVIAQGKFDKANLSSRRTSFHDKPILRGIMTSAVVHK